MEPNRNFIPKNLFNDNQRCKQTKCSDQYIPDKNICCIKGKNMTLSRLANTRVAL
jgi:hypothetical protein